MECRQTRTLIDAYVDGELDARSALELEAHLGGCASCGRALESRRALRAALRGGESLAYPAPAALRRRIRAEMEPSGPSAWLRLRPLALTASLAAAALTLSLGIRQRRTAREDLLAEEVVAGHVRSLEAAHLTDVPSSDKHTVKPWFAGKLDYSPAVEDLAADGFPLIGGRLDYLDGRPVAALVYRRAAHTINLFLWPASGEAAPEARTDRGFHILRWTRNGTTYWAVSDLNAEELSRFAFLLRARE